MIFLVATEQIHWHCRRCLANLNFRLTCQVQAQLNFKLSYLLKSFQYIFSVKPVKVAFAKLNSRSNVHCFIYITSLAASKTNIIFRQKTFTSEKCFQQVIKKKKHLIKVNTTHLNSFEQRCCLLLDKNY
jgi:hypothetical protein